MRLDKFLGASGYGTRKEVKGLIKDKRIFVNDVIAKDPGMSIDEYKDVIRIDDEVITYHLYYYILFFHQHLLKQLHYLISK